LTFDATGIGVYVQKPTIGGRSTPKGWLPAATVTTGAELVYTLGGTPDRTWGSGPSDVPPQN
jgi:putative alpha-1,2-mannosidase